MNILALDLATETGFAMGHPPTDLSKLNSGQFTITPDWDPDCPIARLGRRRLNLEAFLHDVFLVRSSWPDMVVYEAPRDPNAKAKDAYQNTARSSMSISLPIELATTVWAWCFVRGVPCEKVWPQSWRPTYLGKATATKGQDIKRLVINRGEEWGYLRPRTPLKENNRADAIGIWHHAQIKWGKWQPPHELLFGQKVAVVRS